MKTALLDHQQSLVQWVSRATGINTFGVKVRLLGNDLHILCEGTDCPLRWRTLADLLQALQQTDLDNLIAGEQSPIYQVFVYGRKKGEYRPQWCHRVYLNQLDKHLEQVEQALLVDSEKAKQVGGALIVSNESLSRQGNPDAIARYLSESLSNLGIAVKVQIRQYQSKASNQSTINRLWILCQSSYSPDARFLAESIAQKLRHLKLTGFDDAMIVYQVRGEMQPEWRLRVDLTPPEVMLKEWARWGDVQAIARLLTAVFLEIKVSVQVSLKESTLHIFCTPASDPLKTSPVPDKELCSQVVISQLEIIAPQGILATTIYGQKTGDQEPTWIDWLSLPASVHPELATATLNLASSGDEPAMIFLLERLLNPDLDWRLQTGGIRVLCRRKSDLLHIMCDAPVCPPRHQVASKVTQFIRQLKIAGIVGVRVYGRRAGDKEPGWHQGLDFKQRPRLVPEATPEFAATAKYVDTLMTLEAAEPVLRPELTPQEVQSLVNQVTQNWLSTIGNQMKRLLLGSQMFTEVCPENQESSFEGYKLQGGFIWVCLGIILTLQADWMLGYVAAQMSMNLSKNTSKSPSSVIKSDQSGKSAELFAPNPTSSPAEQQSSSTFNASGFTQNGTPGQLPSPPLKEKATATAILLAARSPYPSFKARQLDEQLALYKQRLTTNGHPPDILIIGSSRALRGVDPVALSQALTSHGYAHLDVFNFGINGATAQVVDFIISKVLETAELPKIILWADGSRALNDGREDITFNAIAASEGYQKVLQQGVGVGEKVPDPNNNSTQHQLENKPETSSYQAANQWLNQALSHLSASYKNRDQIKILLSRQLNYLPFSGYADSSSPIAKSNSDPEEDNLHQEVDFDGFLPLSIRFNPTLYFQKHPRVPGDYDNDYNTFQLGGKQDKALQSIVEFTKLHKIALIFVNMPLTGEYLDPLRRKREQEFQHYMLSIAMKNNSFIYRDLSQIWLTANDYFSDPSHLNRYGAYEVSQRLANDPMIPWLVK